MSTIVESRLPHIVALMVFCFAVLSITYGEVIPVAGGLGFDGEFIGRMAKDFWQLVFIDHSTDKYFLGKSAPSGLSNFVFWLVGVSPGSQDIVLFFQFLNLLSFVGVVYLWSAIGRLLHLSFQGLILGYIGLLANFSSLKFPYYYPVLTDSTALLLATLQLFAYLSGRTAILVGACILGAFVWPTLLPAGLIFFVFPRQSESTGKEVVRIDYRLATALAFVLCFSGLILNLGFDREVTAGGASVWRSWLLLSAPLVFGYLFLALSPLLTVSNVTRGLRGLKWRRCLLAVLIISLPAVVIAFFSGVSVMNVTYDDMLANIVISPLAKPLVFLISHHFYYGPVVLLLIFSWKDVVSEVQKLGFGAVLMMSTAVVLSILSESRSLIGFLPFVLALTVKAVSNKISGGYLVVLLGLSLLLSRFWLPINQGFPYEGASFTFPGQYYFMNFGPWMSGPSYLIALMAMLLSLLVIWLAVQGK